MRGLIAGAAAAVVFAAFVSAASAEPGTVRCARPQGYSSFIKVLTAHGVSCAKARALVIYFTHREVLGHYMRFQGQKWRVSGQPTADQQEYITEFDLVARGWHSVWMTSLPYGG